METLRLAMVTEVFHEDTHGERLHARVSEAAEAGAGLAVLPELPLNPWSPADRVPKDDDEEPPGGRRAHRLSQAAAAAGIALLGGAIVRDPSVGRRYNTALLVGADGELIGSYRKVHLPYEEGFWEADHYEAGEEPPTVLNVSGWPVGLQICSDVNRPFGCQLLAAGGAALILAPRATPRETYERWRFVLRANAAMAGAYLVSVNRPGPEAGVSIGAESLAIAPDGTVLVETTERMAFVDLDPAVFATTQDEYPAYLARPSELYARAWADVRQLLGQPLGQPL